MTAAAWATSADPLALVSHLRGPRLALAGWLRRAVGRPTPLPAHKLRQLFDAVIDHPPDWAEPDQLALRTRLRALLDEVAGHDRRIGELLATTSVLARVLVRAADALPDGFSLDQTVQSLLADDRDNPPLAAAIRCLFGDPFQPLPDPTTYRTVTAVHLAQAVEASGDWAALPVLADALEDGGCTHAGMLAHLRAGGPHRRAGRGRRVPAGSRQPAVVAAPAEPGGGHGRAVAAVGRRHRVFAGEGGQRPEPVARPPLQFGQDERDDLRAEADNPLVGRVGGDVGGGRQVQGVGPPLVGQLAEGGGQPPRRGDERGGYASVLRTA